METLPISCGFPLFDQKSTDCCSRNTRITAIVLGIIALAFGALIIAGVIQVNVNLSYGAFALGLVTIAVGSCLKCSSMPKAAEKKLKEREIEKRLKLIENVGDDIGAKEVLYVQVASLYVDQNCIKEALDITEKLKVDKTAKISLLVKMFDSCLQRKEFVHIEPIIGSLSSLGYDQVAQLRDDVLNCVFQKLKTQTIIDDKLIRVFNDFFLGKHQHLHVPNWVSTYILPLCIHFHSINNPISFQNALVPFFMGSTFDIARERGCFENLHKTEKGSIVADSIRGNFLMIKSYFDANQPQEGLKKFRDVIEVQFDAYVRGF